MHKDHKVLVELIIVLVLVAFGLWSLTKDSAAPEAEVNDASPAVAQ